MKSRMTRRTFAKLAGSLVGTMVLKSGPAVGRAEADVTVVISEPRSKLVPTCCHMCGGTTGILCRVVNGRVVKVEPNPDNPVGISNISSDFWEHKDEGGAICPKGAASIMTLYDPERIKRPLRRTNPRKGKGVDPRWREISWDEALDQIVKRLKDLKEAGEEHKLLWFSEDHCFTHIQADFCDLYGTPNFHLHSNLCDSYRRSAFDLVLGYERPLADPVQSRYILLFGWNPLSATKWAHLPRIFLRGIERGAKLVVVDPHLSFTAAKAHEWVPIKPGTDGALALAMGHVIIKEGLYDKVFIEEWAVGFDRYAEYLQDKTPQWAANITGVPAKTIARLAREFATTKPAVVDVWSGPGQRSNCVQSVRAIALLAALTGGIDRPGTLLIPRREGNVHQKVKAKKSQWPRLDGAGTKYPFAHKSGVIVETFERILKGSSPYRPKMAMFIFANYVMAVPNSRAVIEALKKLEFVVVVDTFLSETAELADIVIPGTTFLERYDLNTHWVSWPVVGLRQPVVKPIFGQLPEYEFVITLGKRLGLADVEGKPFFEDLDYEKYLSRELENGAPGITLEELKGLSGATWIDEKGTEYEKYQSKLTPEELKDAVTEGILIYDGPREEGGKQIGFLKDGVPARGFRTPSGKVEFYSQRMEGKTDAEGNSIDPLPVYVPPHWQPDEKYPLYLVNWKETHHTLTRTFNNPWLVELKPENPLMINTRTAKKLGIKNGDEIWVESPYGKGKGRAFVTEGIHPQVVGLQHGFGHWAFGNMAKGKGTHDGQFAPLKADPISGQALHKEVCVKVYKA